MNILLYPHGGSGNHGCEAIVRTTTELLKELDDFPILLSYKKEEDKKYNLDNFSSINTQFNNLEYEAV